MVNPYLLWEMAMNDGVSIKKKMPRMESFRKKRLENTGIFTDIFKEIMSKHGIR